MLHIFDFYYVFFNGLLASLLLHELHTMCVLCGLKMSIDILSFVLNRVWKIAFGVQKDQDLKDSR